MRRRDEAGATLVEFALVSLIVFLLMLGVLQYGYHYWAMQTASATAREAARQIAVGADPRTSGCALTAARDRSGTPALGTVTATSSTTSPTMGTVLTVTVSFQSLDLHLPLLPLPDDGVVTQSADVRVESVHAGTVGDPYTSC